MHLGACSFILQDYYVKAWAENFVMHLRVSDLRLWWDHIVGLDLKALWREDEGSAVGRVGLGGGHHRPLRRALAICRNPRSEFLLKRGGV
jgi:hypothetical protein